MTDEQYYNMERKQDYGRVASRPFKLKCAVFDIADIEYVIEVEFCEDIIEDTFEARIIDNVPFTAEHVLEDIRAHFDSFIDNVHAKLLRVYDNFNHEIK